MHLIGIDLGGTKIEGAIIDPASPAEPVHRLRHATESARGYEHIIGRIAKVVDDLRAAHPGEFPQSLGIGTPGTLDPKTQLQRGSNTQCLNGRPLKADLEARLGMPVVIENDANCFALAEATLGAARGYETVFGIIMGTGCGGGYVVHNKVLHGCHGIAGEWGQLVIEPGGEVSGYGTRGIIEVYIAGPALEAFYEKESGARRGLKEIAARVDEDAAAAATIERLKDYFPRALAFIVDTFDPHAVVIGGGVGNLDVLYGAEMRERIGARIFAPTFEAALLKPQLGDSAGVFGAAMLTAD
ncbi:MAG: ROK family protein [Terrimicrobiaceae bacterium]|nr:ROK family protein [Terrimicrobiaceae bacterium]